MADPWAACFDLDGTLVETEAAWTEAKRGLMRELGGELSEEQLRETVGVHWSLWVPKWCEEHGGVISVEQAKALLVELYDSLVGDIRPVRGAQELLSSLRRDGAALALVTNSERRFARRTAGDLWPYFTAHVCSGDAPQPKPAPDPWLVALSRLGLDADNAVAVEDSAPGVSSAVAAGCVTVAIGADHEGATIWVETLADLDAGCLKALAHTGRSDRGSTPWRQPATAITPVD